MSFTIGETVGGYRITDQLGQGGMATVYRAYDANLDRYVAIKVMHQAFNEDPNFLARFKREAQIVAKLRHPHIVAIYEFDEHKQQPYLVMEFIEGETLKARLKREPLTLEETVKMMQAVGEALTYAHDKGVLHRDIKPSNILLDQDGTPYLTDFGLARMVQAGESTLSQDMMLGTPQYISPEQAQGMKVLGPQTDIYSLGIVLYQLIVGRVPFSADTPYAIIHDHIYKPLPLPSTINPNTPPEVERVLLKALAKEAPDRFASAQMMAEAFQQAVEEAHLEALPAQSIQLPVAETPPATPSSQPAPAIPAAAPASGWEMATLTPAWQRRKRRGEQLWMLGGLASFIFTCLVGLIIAVVAITDPTLRAAAAIIDDNTTEAPAAVVTLPDIPRLSEEEARDLIAADPDDPAGYFALALAQLETRQAVAAQATYTRAENLPATTPYYTIAAAQLALDAGFPNEALALTVQILAETGNDEALRNYTGALLYAIARDATRVQLVAIRRIVETYTDSAAAHAVLARAQIAARQYEAASASLDTALEIDGSLPEAHLILGELYAANEQFNEAEAEWRYARTAADAPAWVVEQANLLLAGNTG